MERMKDKVAIVTGGGKGLGEATAVLFAKEGAKVAVVDQIAEDAQKVTAAIGEQGGDAISIQADVSKSDDVQEMMSRVYAAYGRIDVLINNAGIQGKGAALDLTEAQWDRIFDVNLKSQFLCCKYVIPYMQRNKRGAIVCISSTSGVLAHAGQVAYNASKHGVIGLARCIAFDHGKDGIRVNVICPGATHTPMASSMTSADWEMVANTTMLRRGGQPVEIAYAVLYFASDESSYCTAAVLLVDGGNTAL